MDNPMQRLTVKDLHDFLSHFEATAGEDLKNSEAARYYLALIIFGQILGDRWVQENLLSKEGKPDYFKVSERGEAWYKNQERVTKIAEMLFNFQNIEGFAYLIEKLKKEDVESVVAEVQGAAIISGSGFRIRFRKENYDLDILLADGQVAAGEVKCKLEATRLTSKTVRYAIEKARSQLPKDKAGFVLVKIPENWVREPAVEEIIAAGIKSVLWQSKRTTSLIFWWEEWSLVGGGWLRVIKTREEINPKARFGPGPVRDLAELSWKIDASWIYLDQIIADASHHS